MPTGVAILGIGFLLGMRHATDPDHVIAVSTIVSRERSILHAALIGVLWGFGHTLTILAVGAAIILFGLAIPVRVGLAMELSVGLMLILLGVLNLTGTIRRLSQKFASTHLPVTGAHAHVHSSGSQPPFHVHTRGQGCRDRGASREPHAWLRRPFARLGLYHVLRPLFVGIVHGLAGSAAVALLVLSTIHEPTWAVAYLLVFGVGTVAGMMLITAAMALPFSFVGNRFAWLNRWLVTASGLLSFGFGLFVSYQIGFLDGLITGHPSWTPK